MNKAEYIEYLKTPHWQTLRRLALEMNPGGGCRVCNNQWQLEVHHRTYERVPYNERLADLTVLCEKCHDKFHAKPQPAQRYPLLVFADDEENEVMEVATGRWFFAEEPKYSQPPEPSVVIPGSPKLEALLRDITPVSHGPTKSIEELLDELIPDRRKG